MRVPGVRFMLFTAVLSLLARLSLAVRNGALSVAPGPPLHRDQQVFQQTACNWTVFYHFWLPSFDKGEYRHPSEGGSHCLEVCCLDPTCNGVQLSSNEEDQCYKYSHWPTSKRKDGIPLGDGKWIVSLPKTWSVFLKGTPEEVHDQLELVDPFYFLTRISNIEAVFSSLFWVIISYLLRFGSMALCVVLLSKTLSGSMSRAWAKLRYTDQPHEGSELIQRGCSPKMSK
eukprot:TRINITY_DN1567_c0_g2_i1.p1 TRINITY_DN1567_c0_g2~~TRINITY_DN1567_c0_g2_i1.p1  ORF type:complete len:228 (+),score=28.25 TRINITY_DN1567_c0_g2_i1:116-799(+)